MMRLLTLAVIALTLAGCGTEATPTASDDTTAPGGTKVALASYTVECGCTIDGIGKCGNYIEVDDTFVRIKNGKELGLGIMEWCGQGQHTCEAEGEIVDGEFVAASFTVTD